MRVASHFFYLVIVTLALFPARLDAQSPSQSALVEGAKKEAKLVWYTSMAIDTSKPLLDAFLKEYPFIKADLVRAGEEQLMNRILTETRAGKWSFDAVSTSAISVLAERKIITPYLSPERDAFINEFKDPHGYWLGVFVNNLVIAYNTNYNTAKLLIDFATSKRGQEMVREMRRIPARSDVKPLAPKMDQSKLKLKAVPKEVYLGLDDNAREFRKIFGL